MHKVLVIENEFNEIKNGLDALNLIYFDDNLEFENIVKSQDLNPISMINDYNVILVDIDLSINSEKDGIRLIKDILAFDKGKRLCVITGSSKIDERLKSESLSHIPILVKPFHYKDVASIIETLLN